MKLPFKSFYITDKSVKYSLKGNILSVIFRSGQEIVIKNAYE
jgi:hypothetical protein